MEHPVFSVTCADRLIVDDNLQQGAPTVVVKSRRRHRPERAAEILRHYVEHPAAVDTLEGIARWRLIEDFVEQRVNETNQALQWLVDHEFLERLSSSAAVPPLYRLNARKKREAQQLLARMTSHGPRKPRR